MTDDVTAQKILQDWATSRGFSTTLTVSENRLYFHYDSFNGFAFLDFTKSPALTLTVSNLHTMGASSARNLFDPKIEHEVPQERLCDEYDMHLADEKVFTKIERILERKIDEYEGY